MAILRELAAAIQERRSDLGLSQERLAELAGLSRATVNDLETGRLKSLSLGRAERLANEVGLSLVLAGARPPKELRGLRLAAQAASVSFAKPLPPKDLEHAMLNGIVLPAFIPHLKSLLDEAPLSLLAEAVAEIEIRHGVARSATWQRMRQIARALGCTRGIWGEGA